MQVAVFAVFIERNRRKMLLDRDQKWRHWVGHDLQMRQVQEDVKFIVAH